MKATFFLKVKFMSNSVRKAPPCLHVTEKGRYSPHLVVKDDEEYLGVTFVQGKSVEFDEETDAIAMAIYEDVGYDKLVKGAEFFIMEGPHIVGEGRVENIEVMSF